MREIATIPGYMSQADATRALGLSRTAISERLRSGADIDYLSVTSEYGRETILIADQWVRRERVRRGLETA